VCLAGYHRNMSDFTDLAAQFRRLGGGGWPLVLIDFAGRGRSDDRRKADEYNSVNDAHDVASAMMALGIARAVVLGQGHGGQVAMLLAASHPLLVGGTVLIDAGPMTDSRGIVRLRNNLEHLHALRGKAVMAGFRRVLGGDYPGVPEERLDRLVLRTHALDRRGRPKPLFDRRLTDALKQFSFDDVLVAQWPLFDALRCAPLMMLRTQLTDQLRRETFDEMMRRRPDAVALTLNGQGSPALLDQAEEVEAIADFVQQASGFRSAA
jgi:pimeloyl-ACP methyl ester carboxylesterase